jgi:hypothetical protein
VPEKSELVVVATSKVQPEPPITYPGVPALVIGEFKVMEEVATLAKVFTPEK